MTIRQSECSERSQEVIENKGQCFSNSDQSQEVYENKVFIFVSQEVTEMNAFTYQGKPEILRTVYQRLGTSYFRPADPRIWRADWAQRTKLEYALQSATGTA